MAEVIQISRIVALLKSPPEDNLSTLPPIKPRGGEVYLYQGSRC